MDTSEVSPGAVLVLMGSMRTPWRGQVLAALKDTAWILRTNEAHQAWADLSMRSPEAAHQARIQLFAQEEELVAGAKAVFTHIETGSKTVLAELGLLLAGARQRAVVVHADPGVEGRVVLSAMVEQRGGLWVETWDEAYSLLRQLAREL